VRLLEKAERSFVAKTVDDTRRLMACEKPLFVKVAMLQLLAAKQGERIEGLRRLLSRRQLSETRRAAIQQIIALRSKAMSYLRSTAKFLVYVENHPNALREPPVFNPLPYFSESGSYVRRPAFGDHPFMEAST
jgi:hypothetical protein